jgi:hypothetical protein
MTSVSIMRDITINLIVPCTATHNFAPLPPVPPVPPPLPAVPLALTACAIESPVNMMWPPGMALGSNKFTTTVVHQGMGIALDGHDCGCLIPHVQVAPAPNNMLTLLHIGFSSRKSMFVASTVVMNGKSPACCVMVAWPPSPMVYCADPMSPPLADAVTSYLNSVQVGMTLADWLIGALSIAASMIIDKIFSGGSMPGSWRALGEAALDKLIGAGSLGEFAAKNGLAIATGLARLAFTDGPASVQLTVGSPYLQLQGSVDRGADGSYSGGVTGQVGNVAGQVSTTGVQLTTSGPTGSTQESRNWGQSGPTTTTTDTSPTEGFRTQTTTTDANGNVTTTDSGGRGSSGSLGAPL